MSYQLSIYATDYDIQSGIISSPRLITVKVLLHNTSSSEDVFLFMMKHNYMLLNYMVFERHVEMYCRSKITHAPNYLLLGSEKQRSHLDFDQLYKTMSEYCFKACSCSEHNEFNCKLELCLQDADMFAMSSSDYNIKICGIIDTV